MLVHVTSFAVLGSYKLRIQFTDVTEGTVNLSKELDGEIFEPLKEPEFFQRVHLNKDTGTLEWPNSADFAPEFLSEVGKKQSRKSA